MEPRDDHFAALLIGDEATVVGRRRRRLLLGAADNSLESRVEVGQLDGRLAVASRQQRRLVAYVGQIGTREARRQVCQLRDQLLFLALAIAHLHIMLFVHFVFH